MGKKKNAPETEELVPVRMTTSMAGGRTHAPGDVVELRPDVAAAWIKSQIAVPTETANIEPTETAGKKE